MEEVFMNEPGKGFHGGDCYNNDSAVIYKFHLSATLYVIRYTFCKRTQRVSML